MTEASTSSLDLVLGLMGHWEPLDIGRPMGEGPLCSELEAAGLETELDLLDPTLRMAAYLVHVPDDEPGTIPLVAWVLVRTRASDDEMPAGDGVVTPARRAETRTLEWPNGVGPVEFHNVDYAVPTGRGYEFVVRFVSPNTAHTAELDLFFDAIIASSSLVEVD